MKIATILDHIDSGHMALPEPLDTYLPSIGTLEAELSVGLDEEEP